MESIIYNIQGKKSGSVTLPESIFNVAWNDSLMHQVVTAMQANARTPVAHTKTRGEVRGGGKKPWRQKGTGRARHGSIRSPIWRHGGVTHGPRNEKVFARGIPKKMRAKALFMALSKKFKDGEVIFVDSFGFDSPKTAQAVKVLAAFSKIGGFEKLHGKNAKRSNLALVAFADPTEASIKSFSNIGSIASSPMRDINPVIVLKHKYLIIENPDAAVAIVESRAKKTPAQAPVKNVRSAKKIAAKSA